MITRTLFACGLLLASTAAPVIAAAPGTAPATSAPATRPAPEARTAMRLLLVSTPGFDFPTEEFFIAAKQRGAQLGAVPGAGTDSFGGDTDVLHVYRDGNDVRIAVKLPPGTPPVAAEIADQIVQFTRDYVAQMYEQQRAEARARAERQLAAAHHAAVDANRELKEIRDKLRDLSGRADVSPNTLTAAMSAMDEEMQRLQLERLAKDARRKALEEEIARASERIEKRVESDPIALELQKVVEAREHAAETMKQLHKNGQASQGELHNAIARAAEARAKVLQQQRDAATAAGGTALEAFNRELMTLSIDSREIEAKLKHLEQRLPRLRQAVELLDRYQPIQQRALEANEALAKATREAQRIRVMLQENAPPRVLVKEHQNM